MRAARKMRWSWHWRSWSLPVRTLHCDSSKTAMADRKGRAVARVGTIFGGGIAGSARGPEAPVCVSIGVFVGRVLGTLGADLSFGWVL